MTNLSWNTQTKFGQAFQQSMVSLRTGESLISLAHTCLSIVAHTHTHPHTRKSMRLGWLVDKGTGRRAEKGLDMAYYAIAPDIHLEPSFGHCESFSGACSNRRDPKLSAFWSLARTLSLPLPNQFPLIVLSDQWQPFPRNLLHPPPPPRGPHKSSLKSQRFSPGEARAAKANSEVEGAGGLGSCP